MEKVVITGTGAISALGHSVPEIWGNMKEGVSGVAPISLFDTEDSLVKVACEVKDFDPSKYLPAREVRRRDRFQHFAAVAVKEALEHSGLEITEMNAPRFGVVISTGIGGITAIEENIISITSNGPRKANPFLIPMLMSNGAAGLVGIDHGPQGPAFSVASACASGQDGIGIAWMMLRSGVIDVAIAGASEAIITKTGIAAFDRIGATSRKEPGGLTPQPFDKERDGLVVGEGAGILILEKESHAKARGADILAELVGYGATADASHITAPHEDGLGASRAISFALETGNISLTSVDYINAHGTATKLNDASETNAIKFVFGDLAYKIPISGTKSMTGHMMGATGALETIVCVNVIRENIIPPTINYDSPDPECDLDYTPNTAREIEVKTAMTNAFGFGGHNAVLVVQEYA